MKSHSCIFNSKMILSYFAVLKNSVDFISTDSIKQVLKFLKELASALVKQSAGD